MSLTINFNTPAITSSGGELDSAHVRISATLNKTETSIEVRSEVYRSLQAYLDGRSTIGVDEIPTFLNYILVAITSTQYANLDMLNVHNQLAGFIEDGENHPNWPFADSDPPYPAFLGIKDIDPLNEAIVVMP